MAAIAGSIIGGLLGGTSQSGQKETTNTIQTAQGGSVSNANANSNSQSDIKTAEVKDAAKPIQQNGTPTPTETEKTQTADAGTGKDWSQLAKMAQNLMSSGGGGQSQNMNFNATSQAQPLATF